MSITISKIIMLASGVHKYNTIYSATQNHYISRVKSKIGKESISFMVTNIWNELSPDFKELRRLQGG